MTAAAPLKERLNEVARPLVGLWLVSASPLVAELCSGSGFDILVIDAEHGPNELTSVLSQLQVTQASSAATVVRVPQLDGALIKRYLDIGAESLLIPMVDNVQDAQEAVAATRYPPEGVRGVGSAFARAAQWNRVPDYLNRASDRVSVIVQIETISAVEQAAAIASVGGVDAVFVGPADLAASMCHLGAQDHQDVVAAVERTIASVKEVGKPVGVNAFDERLARHYCDCGADFVLVSADVTLLRQSTESLAARAITLLWDNGS